jgi:hypothetical protein
MEKDLPPRVLAVADIPSSDDGPVDAERPSRSTTTESPSAAPALPILQKPARRRGSLGLAAVVFFVLAVAGVVELALHAR